MTKFHNKQGLTEYSFLCGYMQQVCGTYKGAEYTVELYLDASVYAVRVFIDSERREWVCETNLPDARLLFAKFVRQYLPWLVLWAGTIPKAGKVHYKLDESDRLGHWICLGLRGASKWEAVNAAWLCYTGCSKGELECLCL